MKNLLLLALFALCLFISCTTNTPDSSIELVVPETIIETNITPSEAIMINMGSGFTLRQTDENTVLEYKGDEVHIFEYDLSESPFFWYIGCEVFYGYKYYEDGEYVYDRDDAGSEERERCFDSGGEYGRVTWEAFPEATRIAHWQQFYRTMIRVLQEKDYPEFYHIHLSNGWEGGYQWLYDSIKRAMYDIGPGGRWINKILRDAGDGIYVLSTGFFGCSQAITHFYPENEQGYPALSYDCEVIDMSFDGKSYYLDDFELMPHYIHLIWKETSVSISQDA